jgi:hypothetical protein
MSRRRAIRRLYALYVAEMCQLHGLAERLEIARIVIGRKKLPAF